MKIKRLILGITFILILGVLWGLNQQLFNWGFAPKTVFDYTPLPTFVSSSATEHLLETPTVSETGTSADLVSLPASALVEWALFVDGFDRPVAIANAGDGSGRLFIVEQAGLIWVVNADRSRNEQPFLDLRDRVGRSGNEQGLLGLAFHPDYADNGFFVVHYSDLRGDTVIARFRVSADPDMADPVTEVSLFNMRQPYANHNGGGLVFGPDGYLYIGFGDGGLANDPKRNGQSLDTYLGKILRMDVGTGLDEEAVRVPTDNPFINSEFPLIWAYGLRNPWRFSFDALTGDLFIADVGQNSYEEINYLQAGTAPGVNFGWDYYEGLDSFEGQPPEGLDVVFPVVAYGRDFGCSVTGGEVYRGENLPDWQGVYLYGDFCTGNIWGLLQSSEGSWQNELLFETDFNISSFGVDESDEVYLADLGGGIYILVSK